MLFLGILLVANPPDGATVWKAANYITPLSDGAKKIEYTFPPGTSFLIQDVIHATIKGKKVVIIILQALGSG